MAHIAPTFLPMTKPLLHFSHANSYPAGTYRQLFAALSVDFDVRAYDLHGHDPRYPVDDGWRSLTAELIEQLEGYGQPVILVGHSLGGVVSLLAASQRPELARCVVMLDSPVVAGWRAWLWRLAKWRGLEDRFSPSRLSVRRRVEWPDADSARAHFAAKPMFAAWAPGVLDDYLASGLTASANGVQLRFSREIETEIYRTLPHDMGALLAKAFPVPVGFIGGTRSEELRLAGLAATRKLVGANFTIIEGGHLYPMESPLRTAQELRKMIGQLLPPP
jgi:pimeloyl-ACP methyl ester carboxylesterase